MNFTKKIRKPKVPSHTQILHYDNGTKLTCVGVIHVWQDTLIHLVTDEGRHYLVNPTRVLHTEIIYDK